MNAGFPINFNMIIQIKDYILTDALNEYTKKLV